MDLPFGMEVDVAVVADGVVSLKMWGSGGNSGMPGTDSLERAAEALQGRKFCEFTLFYRLCRSLHHFALRPLERHDGRKYLPPARC